MGEVNRTPALEGGGGVGVIAFLSIVPILGVRPYLVYTGIWIIIM